MILSPDIIQAAQIIWDFHHVRHALAPCDMMLVLGSHDLRVADHAADLYHRGFAPQIVISGGIAHTDDLLATGWDQTEADMFAAQMISLGVPDPVIMRERHATNTGQNYSLSKQMLAAAGVAYQSILVVTKPYMERRALATADVQLPDKTVTVTSPPAPDMVPYLEHAAKGIATEISIMVGDLQRFDLYAAKGFMSVQVIPPHVREAFDDLVEQGFTGNLVK